MVYNFALLCALMLAGLAFASVRATGRADSPATLLCGIWALVFSLYWLAGDLFYPVDVSTLILLTLAPVVFFIGATANATAASVTSQVAPPVRDTRPLRAAVVLWLLVLLACLPAYFAHFAGEVSDDSQINFIAAIRLATLQNEGEVTDFSPLKNLQPFAYALPLVSLIAFEGQKLKGTLVTLAAMLLAICYGLLTGSKSVVPSLAVSFCIVLVAKNNGRVRGSGALPILAGGVLGFLTLIRFVNYTFAEDANEWDLWVAAVQGIASYLCAPIAGLNFYLNSPEAYDLSPQHLARPLYYMANSVLHLVGRAPLMELPSIHLQFFDPGPGFRGTDYNTYTYLSAYIASTNTYLFLVFPFLMSILLARLHRLATPKNIFALLLYAYVARALALSFGGEMLILDIANIIKFGVVIWAMTSLTPSLINRAVGWFRLPRSAPPL